MSKVVITINTENAAFSEDYPCELIRILRVIERDLPSMGKTEGWCVFDRNGNTVGDIVISD